jgi:hypothetical protein
MLAVEHFKIMFGLKNICPVFVITFGIAGSLY